MKTVRLHFHNKDVIAVAALLTGLALLSLAGHAQAQIGPQASRLHALPDPVLPWGNAAVPLLGWVAACLTLGTFACADGLRLRVAALSANAAFVAYGSMAGLMPVLVLHLALIPINLWRLTGVLRSLRAASVTVPDLTGDGCRPRGVGHVSGGGLRPAPPLFAPFLGPASAQRGVKEAAGSRQSAPSIAQRRGGRSTAANQWPPSGS